MARRRVLPPATRPPPTENPWVDPSEISPPSPRKLPATSCAISRIPWPCAEILGWRQKRCKSAIAASLFSSIQVRTGPIRSAGVEIDIELLLREEGLGYHSMKCINAL